MHLSSTLWIILASFSVTTPTSQRWDRVGNLFFTGVLVMRRVWIRASMRYRAIVLRIKRDLSSLPTMQVETRRQQESGQGMEENWAHHRLITILRGEKLYLLYTLLLFIIFNMIPDIESKHKGYRDQARMFLDNQTTLFKFILLKKGSMKTVAGAANHLTACQPYWLRGPY